MRCSNLHECLCRKDLYMTRQLVNKGKNCANSNNLQFYRDLELQMVSAHLGGVGICMC